LYHGITTEVLKLRGHNEDEIEAYLARPQGEGTAPGVVIIHHAPGWDEWTLEVCWRLANRGFAAISPHLYSRHGPGDPDDAAARARLHGGMSDAEVIGDVSAAANYLRGRPYSNGKVGVMGFCSGGRQTYLVACSVPGFDAAVNCWGGGVIVDDPSRLNDRMPVAPITLTSNLNCPLLGIFGNEDESPSPDEVNRVEAELRAQDKTFEFYRYDGAGHAFLSTDRHRYRPEQAVDAWNKIYAFFNRYLKAPTRGMVPQFIGPSPTVSLAGHIPLRTG
jgi:carboxymethylenebutenolidase